MDWWGWLVVGIVAGALAGLLLARLVMVPAACRVFVNGFLDHAMSHNPSITVAELVRARDHEQARVEQAARHRKAGK